MGAVGLLAAAVVGLPAALLAQGTNTPAAERKSGVPKAAPAAKKKSAHPFRGKLAAVDKTAKTIQVGKSIYYITSETKITKAGQPATLADGVVGEPTTGYVKPTEDGKMTATTLRFWPKAENASGATKKGEQE
jgi:hypothetical protein